MTASATQPDASAAARIEWCVAEGDASGEQWIAAMRCALLLMLPPPATLHSSR